MALTARPTSRPVPHRPWGTSPSAISRSYLAFAPAVMSVAMMPGRTSRTWMPSPASRTAQSWEAMASPALEMQYSPRFTDAVWADIDDTKTSLYPPESRLPPGWARKWRATSWARKYGPFRLTATTSSKLSSVASRMSARTRGAIPALLTRASNRPISARVPATIA